MSEVRSRSHLCTVSLVDDGLDVAPMMRIRVAEACNSRDFFNCTWLSVPARSLKAACGTHCVVGYIQDLFVQVDGLAMSGLSQSCSVPSHSILSRSRLRHKGDGHDSGRLRAAASMYSQRSRALTQGMWLFAMAHTHAKRSPFANAISYHHHPGYR